VAHNVTLESGSQIVFRGKAQGKMHDQLDRVFRFVPTDIAAPGRLEKNVASYGHPGCFRLISMLKGLTMSDQMPGLLTGASFFSGGGK
jgi:hypothetical protein